MASWGQEYHVHQGDLILRVLVCTATISCAVYLVLWPFYLALYGVAVCKSGFRNV